MRLNFLGVCFCWRAGKEFGRFPDKLIFYPYRQRLNCWKSESRVYALKIHHLRASVYSTSSRMNNLWKVGVTKRLSENHFLPFSGDIWNPARRRRKKPSTPRFIHTRTILGLNIHSTVIAEACDIRLFNRIPRPSGAKVVEALVIKNSL